MDGKIPQMSTEKTKLKTMEDVIRTRSEARGWLRRMSNQCEKVTAALPDANEEVYKSRRLQLQHKNGSTGQCSVTCWVSSSWWGIRHYNWHCRKIWRWGGKIQTGTHRGLEKSSSPSTWKDKYKRIQQSTHHSTQVLYIMCKSIYPKSNFQNLINFFSNLNGDLIKFNSFWQQFFNVSGWAGHCKIEKINYRMGVLLRWHTYNLGELRLCKGDTSRQIWEERTQRICPCAGAR